MKKWSLIGIWMVPLFIVSMLASSFPTASFSEDAKVRIVFEWATTYMSPWIIVILLAAILLKLPPRR
ncbi:MULTISPECIES: hypothetical protein [unclassified Paenibacillus]|uniref:hypothetical protein n=1 Tax=Paenibacillus TaxID=44249 RepID=UPI00038FF4AD|nr:MULTISPECIES: hypothetical protein [unclassified Paenibacillus]KKC46303.1 hypothetical protein VE23_02905 [Paenibacillus sp. D9]CDN41984.1 hypothetical protein BN871_AS_00050 [Paenibacillus sp. P22]